MSDHEALRASILAIVRILRDMPLRYQFQDKIRADLDAIAARLGGDPPLHCARQGAGVVRARREKRRNPSRIDWRKGGTPPIILVNGKGEPSPPHGAKTMTTYTVRDDNGDTIDIEAPSAEEAAREDAHRTLAHLGADCPDPIWSTVLVDGEWTRFSFSVEELGR